MDANRIDGYLRSSLEEKVGRSFSFRDIEVVVIESSDGVFKVSYL
jgi:hypothetical protein